MIHLDDLFFARFTIAEIWILPARLTARSTLILLLPIRRFAVLDKLFAATVVALDDFADHPLAYQSLLSHYPIWFDGSRQMGGKFNVFIANETAKAPDGLYGDC